MYKFRSSSNRILKSALTTAYDIEPVPYTTSGGSDAHYYRVTRTASKSYRYVDLTKDAAGDVLGQMRKLYTRQTVNLKPFAEEDISAGKVVPDQITYGELRSSIYVERTHGDSYDVVVDVHELDVRASQNSPASPASLFSTENARDYDTATINNTINIISIEAI